MSLFSSSAVGCSMHTDAPGGIAGGRRGDGAARARHACTASRRAAAHQPNMCVLQIGRAAPEATRGARHWRAPGGRDPWATPPCDGPTGFGTQSQRPTSRQLTATRHLRGSASALFGCPSDSAGGHRLTSTGNDMSSNDVVQDGGQQGEPSSSRPARPRVLGSILFLRLRTMLLALQRR